MQLAKFVAGFAAFGCALGLSPLSSAQNQPNELQIESRIAGPDGSWGFVTFDPHLRRVYVARGDGVTALDISSGAVTGRLAAGERTHIALPINNGAEILVTNAGAHGAFIADSTTGAVRVSAIHTGEKPDAALLEPLTGQVWVMDNAGGGITLVDPHSGAVVGAIATPGALETPVSDGEGRVYVTVEDLGEIVVVDARAHSVLAHWKLDGCAAPTGLALDRASHRLVAECANGKAAIVSSANGAAIASVPIGPRPDALAYDPRRHLMFAPTAGDGMMRVIDPAHARVVATVQTQMGCRGAALDPGTGKLYLPAGHFDPSASPGARPTLTPGSFQILVVAPTSRP